MPVPGVLPDVPTFIPPFPVLARDTVRYVGEAVAFVVADTLTQAKDAAEAITVDWQPLPHVIGAMEALKPDATKVWLERPDNLAFSVQAGDAQATKQAFAKATRVIELIRACLPARPG